MTHGELGSLHYLLGDSIIFTRTLDTDPTDKMYQNVVLRLSTI